MYSVACMLHGVRCSQCVYRWLVKSKLHVWWSFSRVVHLDEEREEVARASTCAGGIAGIWMLRDMTRGGLEEGVAL
jgi:DNA-directed RNA polymerase subunit RPC12/RpoP